MRHRYAILKVGTGARQVMPATRVIRDKAGRTTMEVETDDIRFFQELDDDRQRIFLYFTQYIRDDVFSI